MDKKAVSIQDNLDAYNKELLDSKPLYDAEVSRLEMQAKQLELLKKQAEISLLHNQLKDYKLTKIMAYVGAIAGLVSLLLSLLKLFAK